MASAEWLPLLDRVGSAFNPGAAQRSPPPGLVTGEPAGRATARCS